jgi:hypothetical protein
MISLAAWDKVMMLDFFYCKKIKNLTLNEDKADTFGKLALSF